MPCATELRPVSGPADTCSWFQQPGCLLLLMSRLTPAACAQSEVQLLVSRWQSSQHPFLLSCKLRQVEPLASSRTAFSLASCPALQPPDFGPDLQSCHRATDLTRPGSWSTSRVVLPSQPPESSCLCCWSPARPPLSVLALWTCSALGLCLWAACRTRSALGTGLVLVLRTSSALLT